MASILLKKPYRQTRDGKATDHRAGEVVSVPYFEGLEMVKAGVGVRWNGGVGHEPPAAPPQPRPAPPPEEPKPAAEAKPKAQPKQQTRPAEARPAEAKTQTDKGD